jgi:hypothetical protein
VTLRGLKQLAGHRPPSLYMPPPEMIDLFHWRVTDAGPCNSNWVKNGS